MINETAIRAAVNPSAIVARAALTTAFDIVDKAIEGRASIPILANARLQGDGDRLFVTGTDWDLEIVAAIHAAADSRFDATIPAGAMRKFLKGAPKAEYVALEMINDGETVAADFEKIRYSLQALPSADFSELTGPGDTASHFTMTGREFLDGLEGVKGAISTEQTRYYLNGLFLTIEERGGGCRQFRMVATDGHRLYMQNLAMPDGLESLPRGRNDMAGVIIPHKAVTVLAGLMGGKKCPSDVSIWISDAKARFQWEIDGGSITLTTKLVDGTFPTYQRVIPSMSDAMPAVFDGAELAEKIKAVSLISSERGRAFKMSLSNSGAALAVNNPDQGRASAQLPCDWTGRENEPEMEIGFNAGYALAILDIAGPGDVTFHFTHSDSPAIVTGSRAGWLAVLMPMRV